MNCLILYIALIKKSETPGGSKSLTDDPHEQTQPMSPTQTVPNT